jgi:DNA transposition AAA+ family ATPase
MKVVSVLSLCLGLALATVAVGAESVSRTVNAPEDRVWTVAEAVLKHQGWEIEKADRGIGWITTKSRMLEGGDYGVYAKGLRHQLRVHVKGAGAGKTTVSVERSVFNRERILWMDKDEPVAAKDQAVEKTLLDDIGKSL